MFQTNDLLNAKRGPVKRYIALCLLLLWCLVVSTVYARGLAPQTSSAELFTESGLRELVVQIPGSTASSFEASLTSDRLPEQFSEVSPRSIKAAIHKAFGADTFNKHLVRELEQGMSEDAREFMLEWYASELGQRFKQAELDNSLLSEQSRFERFQNELFDSTVETDREQLIFRLDETMRTSESAVDMMIHIQMAFNLSMSSFMPEGQRLTNNEIEQIAQQNRSRWLAQYRSQTRDVLLFTYQDFNNEELSQINEVLESYAGQAFIVAVNDGIKKAMFASSLNLGDELGKLLDKAEGKTGI